ncbi:MAG: hypothetical protein HOJ35_01485 [Bdellovibrionales bacterium]|jgi:hypothetical protein|nr:hypothetical protein [Bdellovibrionales bacterium]
MCNHISKLRKLISPEVTGIIWPTDIGLKEFPQPFFDLDYFMDGIITKYVNNDYVDQNNNIFYANSFDSQIFLANIKISNDLNEVMTNLLLSLLPQKQSKHNILIIWPDSKLKNQFKNSQYENTEFTHYIINELQ